MISKPNLVQQIAEKGEMTKKDAELALTTVLACIQSNLEEGEKIQLKGFGCFEVKERQARTGINPRTGEPVEIKAVRAPKFRASKSLKEAVDKGT